MTATVYFGNKDSVLSEYTLGSNKDVQISNSTTSGKIINKLGTTSNATEFDVQNSSGGVLLSTDGAGATLCGGSLYSKTTVTTEATAGAHTYTAAELTGGLILRDCSGASRSDPSDTAANIVAAIKNAQVGTSFEFRIRNTSDAAETITLTAGSGVTLVGTMTIAQSKLRLFIVVLTNVSGSSEAATIYSYD